ncbi:hypothetical protein [Vibrio mediterranei]|uniref:hypothetical protein n=1 Tax=Vibrio mediterranei TaxID=689 RepID=UPI00406825DB
MSCAFRLKFDEFSTGGESLTDSDKMLEILKDTYDRTLSDFFNHDVKKMLTTVASALYEDGLKRTPKPDYTSTLVLLHAYLLKVSDSKLDYLDVCMEQLLAMYQIDIDSEIYGKFAHLKQPEPPIEIFAAEVDGKVINKKELPPAIQDIIGMIESGKLEGASAQVFKVDGETGDVTAVPASGSKDSFEAQTGLNLEEVSKQILRKVADSHKEKNESEAEPTHYPTSSLLN